MTTAELLACEQRLIAAAIRRAGEHAATLGDPLIDKALARATKRSPVRIVR